MRVVREAHDEGAGDGLGGAVLPSDDFEGACPEVARSVYFGARTDANLPESGCRVR